MPVSCLPNDLLDAARCYRCVPVGEQGAVIIYLLNQILGTGLTTQQLMDNSVCFKCIPSGMQADVQTYLLCQIANSVGA
jgi:hypothetical protein